MNPEPSQPVGSLRQEVLSLFAAHGNAIDRLERQVTRLNESLVSLEAALAALIRERRDT